MRRIFASTLILIAGLLSLSAPCVFAQDVCEGNFDCDQDVDGTDAAVFKSDFGRSQFSNPCPDCEPCPYEMVDCGNKCVDPMTDEDYCGANLDCLEGTVCGINEQCVTGMCEIIGEVIYQAGVPKTGQTIFDATGDDGDLEKGVAWPNPRFTDNINGTVADNLTGLIWLKDANCFATRGWNNALSDCNGLADGSCGLTDGSQAGDWRLPNRRELFSLTHDDYFNPAIPDTPGSGQWSQDDPFTNVQSSFYWSSTNSSEVPTDRAWYVNMHYGVMSSNSKSSSYHVWPVRGGQ